MKEFIMVRVFNSPALMCRYLTIRKIPKRKVLSVVYNGKQYVLFYYTTIRKEEKYSKRYENVPSDYDN